MRTRAVVAAGLACLVTAAPAMAGDPSGPGVPRTAASGHQDPQPSGYPANSSGGEPGWLAPTGSGHFRSGIVRVDGPTWQVAPGLTYSQWSQTDDRGPIRAYLLRADLRTPGLRLDYAAQAGIASVATVPNILAIDGAVAGVNGDFYDIGRTGAPLGVGKDRQRGLLHGRNEPNAAFYLDSHGQPTVSALPLHLAVARHPEITLEALNPPYVRPDTVALYRSNWGQPTSYRLTHGQHTKIRTVWVQHGRIVRIGTRLTPKPLPKPHKKKHHHRKKPRPLQIKGALLVARGAPAVRSLRGLKVGMRLRFHTWAAGRPRMAITGSQFLVEDGVVRALDDRVMHPRTAIGIDHDTGEVLLLVVDGRQEDSRGYTMMELANLMVELGADDAINLDGGGSSTMVATPTNGKARVVNTPSDGFQRRVANAVELTYRAPAPARPSSSARSTPSGSAAASAAASPDRPTPSP